MLRNLPRFLLALVLLATGLVANPFVDVPGASAAAVWRDGSPQTTRVINCVGIIQGNPWEEVGLNTWVGFSTDPDAGKPEVGQVYYVHIVLGAPGNPCPGGQLVWTDIVLPPNTVPAISQSAPTRCQYQGESWRTNCAQLQQKSANQFWVANPANPNAEYAWPMATGAVLELQIPVVSSAPIASAPMSAVVTVADGSPTARTLQPQVPVFVFSANNQPPSTPPTFTFPTPSTTIQSTAAAPGFAVESVAYLQPNGNLGNAYYDLSLSSTMSPTVFGQGPVAVGSDPNGYELYSDWTGYALQPGTTYYWRPRYQPNGKPEVVGATQSFTTPASSVRVIGDGSPASCSAAAVNSAAAALQVSSITFNCGPQPVSIQLTQTLVLARTVTIDGDDLVTLVAPPGARHIDVMPGNNSNNTIVLRDLILTGANHATGCGAIKSYPPAGGFANLTIDSSRITGNTVTAGAGGAICSLAGSNLAITGSSVSGNRALADAGGAIFSQHNLNIYDSELSGNLAGGNGGAVAAVAGSLIAERSTFAGNTAGAPSSASAVGGAVLTGGYTKLHTSTFSGNTAGHASAIAANGVEYVEINGDTITGNTARNPAGAALVLASSATSDRIENSIIVANAPRSCPTNGADWQIASLGYNQTDGPCTLGAAGDRTDAVANLGPLGYNGGPTRTHPLLPGSSAIDAGNNNRCGAKDQRGVSIPTGIGTTRSIDGNFDGVATCDVGAFEIKPDGTAPTVAGVDRLDASPTAAASVRWRVRFSEPVVGFDAADVALATGGLSGAGVSAVAPESAVPAANWVVTAAAGAGTTGTLRLDVPGAATIRDATNMAFAAAASGSTYTIDRVTPGVPGGPGNPGGPATPGGPGNPGGTGSVYAPFAPVRLADTRSLNATIDGVASGGGPVGAGQVLTVPVAGRGGVPAGSTAVSLNVTIVDPQGAGYATVWPCDQPQPNASNLNYSGSTIPNAVISKLAGDGSVCIYTYSAAHVLVDANGAFPAASEFTSLVPARVADTRSPNATIDGVASGGGPVGAGQVLTVPVAGRGGVPAGSTAVSLNVTIVDPQSAGYATVWPCDQPQPNASNLNYASGGTIPNAVLTKLAGDGSVCIFTYAATHVLVDVNGAFGGTTTFNALVPARLADTRDGSTTVDGEGIGFGPVLGDVTFVVEVAGRGGLPVGARAASLNITAADPGGAGYLTVWPCDQPQPNASNLNYQQGQTIPNAVLTQLSADGRVCIYTSAPTHLLVDVNGAL